MTWFINASLKVFIWTQCLPLGWTGHRSAIGWINIEILLIEMYICHEIPNICYSIQQFWIYCTGYVQYIRRSCHKVTMWLHFNFYLSSSLKIQWYDINICLLYLYLYCICNKITLCTLSDFLSWSTTNNCVLILGAISLVFICTWKYQ